MTNGKGHKIQRIMNSTDDLLQRLPLIELAGTHRVLIENYYCVTAYTDQEISVKVKYGNIKICGEGLRIVKISNQQMVIVGGIQQVFLYKR